MQRNWRMSMPLLAAASIVSVLVAGPQPGPTATEGFNELIRTVREGDPVRVESVLVLESSIGDVVERTDPLVAVYVLDGPGRGLVRLKGWRLTADEGQVIIEHDREPDAYVRVEHAGTPLAAMRKLLRSLPDPYLALALGSSEPASLLKELHDEDLGLVPTESGSESIRFTGDTATLELSLDAVGRPVEGELILTGGRLPEDVRLRWHWTWSHASLSRDELEAAMQFDRRGRQRVDSPQALRRKVAALGSTGEGHTEGSPGLELEGDDGQVNSLASLKGQVVLVEFWASWCSPCMRSLPALQARVKKWAEEGHPVVLLSVNTLEVDGENTQTLDSRIQLVQRVRRAHGIDVPVLLDLDDAVAEEWGVTALPATFVIDGKGRITTRLTGHGPGSMEELEQAVEAVLVELGGSPPGDGSQ